MEKRELIDNWKYRIIQMNDFPLTMTIPRAVIREAVTMPKGKELLSQAIRECCDMVRDTNLLWEYLNGLEKPE